MTLDIGNCRPIGKRVLAAHSGWVGGWAELAPERKRTCFALSICVNSADGISAHAKAGEASADFD